ncbi:MAG: hypothetical protein AAB386_02530 [Patescibacteria group bacterium]
MEKRNKLILLILVALILLAIGIWILLKPFLSTPEQPPTLPTGVIPSGVQPTIPTGGSVPVVTPQDVKELEDLASAIVARIGSGSSMNGFKGYEDVLINATPSFQQKLTSEQQAMQKKHPVSGSAFGMVTRVVAVDSKSAVSGADVMPIILQVQQAEDAGNPSAPTKVSYKEVTVIFEKQTAGGYLLDGLSWKEVEL